jgi:hypothetical protein
MLHLSRMVFCKRRHGSPLRCLTSLRRTTGYDRDVGACTVRQRWKQRNKMASRVIRRFQYCETKSTALIEMRARVSAQDTRYWVSGACSLILYFSVSRRGDIARPAGLVLRISWDVTSALQFYKRISSKLYGAKQSHFRINNRTSILPAASR